MKQVPDRKKLRREYLRKRFRAYWTATTLLVLPALYVSLIVLGFRTHNVILILGSIPFLAIFSFGVLIEYLQARKYSREEYVPPVTPSTLPAAEVLVRGADVPPIAQSDVLLRAASEQETPKEQLLRATEGER